MATVISIGRNINGVPMDDEDWYDFKAETYSAVVNTTGVVYFAGEGSGIYQHDREQAFTLVAETVDYDDWYESLRSRLGRIATAYNQESIALTIGATEFVKGVVRQ